MDEFLLTLIAILSVATIGAAFEYYKQVRKAQEEYERAKGSVEDVVLSFNRELKREANKLEVLAFRVEGLAAKSHDHIKRANSGKKMIEPLENKVQSIVEQNSSILAQLSDVSAEIRDVKTSNETLRARVTVLDEQLKEATTIPEVSSLPVIPIKRDKAIAALTDTELTVLEMLSSEGPKTAPEMKERVQLSREHTARLMKKLYEKGYLERETGKIPFKYSLKKEMEKILKKPETGQT